MARNGPARRGRRRRRSVPANFWPHANYWYDHCGIRFDEASYSNPDAMVDRGVRQLRFLHERFGRLGVGEPDPRPQPVVTSFGVTTVAALLGSRVRFLENDEPYAIARNVSEEELAGFRVPADFESMFPVDVYLDEASYLRGRFGKAQILVNYQSVLNTALKFRGEELMVDFHLNPDLARKVLDICFETMENLREFINRKNREFGCPTDDLRVQSDNCTVELISPETYRDFILPYDQGLAHKYARNYGVHHCGPGMHRYAPYYGMLRSARWYDMGFGSDVRECIQHFAGDAEAEKEFQARYGPVRLLNARPDEIRHEVRDLVASGATALQILGVDSRTPDRNIEAYLLAAAGSEP